MGNWPIYGHTGIALSSAGTLTTGGTDNTKGSYLEIVASTSYDIYDVAFTVRRKHYYYDFLVDIAVGADESEEVIIPNLLFPAGYAVGDAGGTYRFPIYIPAGSRIACRGQSENVSNWLDFTYILGYGTFNAPPVGGLVTTYGANTSDSGGTEVDPGGTAWTWGVYQELSSVTNVIKALNVGIGHHSDSNTDAIWHVAIAVGAEGLEQDLFWFEFADNNIGVLRGDSQLYHIDVPEGSRLSARALCSITTATERLVDVVAYGIS